MMILDAFVFEKESLPRLGSESRGKSDQGVLHLLNHNPTKTVTNEENPSALLLITDKTILKSIHGNGKLTDGVTRT